MAKKYSGHEYDVSLSFAGEDREYVERVASELRARDIRVFYDKYEKVKLWGRDLYVHLADVYQNAARYCVIFISRHYSEKLWTTHERQNAQARAFRENEEYLLPARFDDTKIPGLPETIGYIDLHGVSPVEFTEMIEEKVMPSVRENYFPTSPVGLFESLGVEDDDERSEVNSCARHFFEALQYMKSDERDVLFQLFTRGCPSELPDNIHISQDFLSRLTGFTIRKLRRILGAISSLGFYTTECQGFDEDKHLGEGKLFVLEWHDTRVEGMGNATGVADEIIKLVAMNHCNVCAVESLRRLDFRALENIESGEDGEA